MSKKSDTRNGLSLGPEFREIVRRLKDKEPELQEIVNREGSKTMPTKVEKMAEGSRQTRLEMYALVQTGLTENEALKEIYPKTDRNRTHRFRRWKAAGLWPVPESELIEAGAQETEPEEVDTDKEPKPDNSPQSEVNNVTQCIDTKAELLEKMRALLDTIEPAERPIGATAKGRPSPLKTILVAVRLPLALNEELTALKTGKGKSYHIEKAIMAYLKIMKGNAADE